MAYQIQFKSFRSDTLYTVRVGTGSDTIQLTGAAEPFTTEEDNDEDFFCHLRIQTGYMRFVDDGYIPGTSTAFDWRTLLPDAALDQPVVLTEGNDVVWRGFIQMQQPDSVIYEYPCEREYAIYDILGVCQYVEFDLGITSPTVQYVNFATLIKTVIDSLPFVTRPIYCYFQDYNHASQKLLAKVNPQLFYNISEALVVGWQDNHPLNRNVPRKYKCSDVLEEIAKFWGFTVRTHNGDLYFTQNYTTATNTDYLDMLRVSYAQLSTLAGGTSAGDLIRYAGDTTIHESQTVSTSNILQPVKSYDGVARVTADVGEYTDIIDTFPEGVRKAITGWIWGGSEKVRVSQSGCDSYMAQCHKYKASGAMEYHGKLFGFINEAEKFGTGEKTYDYFGGFMLARYTSMSNYAEIETLWPFNFAECLMSMTALFFDMNGKISRVGSNDPAGKTEMKMSIEFLSANGNTYYFNGYRWITTAGTTFQCYVAGSDDYIYPFSISSLDNRKLIIKYISFNSTSQGTGALPVPIGRLRFRIYGDSQSKLGVGKFAVEVKRHVEPSLEANTENEYTRDYVYPAMHVRPKDYMEWTVDTIFASENRNQFGIGTVLNNNNTPLTTITMADGNQYHPEKWIVNIVESYYKSQKLSASFDLRSELSAINALTPASRITYKGLKMHPVSISRSWRDDKTTIMALQVQGSLVSYLVTPVAGTGIVSVSGGGTVYVGDPTVVTCVVSAGYFFDHWEDANGNVVSTSQSYNIPSVTGNFTLTAVAIPDSRKFTVTLLNTLGVTSVIGAGTYTVGTVVEIDCVVDSDHRFVAWTEDNNDGEIISTSPDFSLTVRRAITLYPNVEPTSPDDIRISFYKVQPAWGQIVSDNDEVINDGDAYEMIVDELRVFTAVPATGYMFSEWQKDGAHYSDNQELTISADTDINGSEYTAVFAVQPVASEWTLTLRSNVANALIDVMINGVTTRYNFTSPDTVYDVIIPLNASVRLSPGYSGDDPLSWGGWLDATEGVISQQILTFNMVKNRDLTVRYV